MEKKEGNKYTYYYFPLGLKSLRENSIVHQDLKPENILVKEGINGPEAYIADVGVAKRFANQSILKKQNTLTTVAGTMEWMAPEVRGESIKIDYRKIDIFSLGLISLYCLDSPNNFNNTNKDKNLNQDSNKLHEEYLPRLKSKVPIEFYCILKSMLSFDWNARPSLEELNDFIANYRVIYIHIL